MMIRIPLTGLVGGMVFLTGIYTVKAQTSPERPDIKIHTVMERYEPGLVLSPQERLRMKTERREEVENREAVIDTLQIPGRKKRKLLRELHRTPFTDMYEEVLSSLEPYSEEEENPE